MSHKNKAFLIRAYVRKGITRIPIDVQKYEIQKVVDELGLEIRWYTDVVDKAKSICDERDLWSHQLRSDEAGLIHSLPVLRLTRKQLGRNVDPKDDFAGFVSSIGGLYVMEASTGLTSKQRAKWRNAVTAVSSKPPLGSKSMTKEQASKLAKDGWKTRNKGVVVTWKSEARKKERNHLIRHWLASTTAKTAHQTLSEFIEDMDGSVYEELKGVSSKTLERICDIKRNA